MKPNNPRVFAETVSIDAWRTEYKRGKAEADLHIDVVFSEGRIGGNEASESPVRFRMSLKRAEVHVRRDLGGVIKIPSSSVKREPLISGKSEYTEERSGNANAGIEIGATSKGVEASLDVNAQASTQVTKRYEETGELPRMSISHHRTAEGYAFRIEPTREDRLLGQPWSADDPRMKLVDTKAARKRGDPPEVVVDIRCKREDLIIEDVQFKDEGVFDFVTLPRTKRVAVEQYIKQEIERMGLACGDLSEPFSSIVLGDVSPHAE